MAARGHYSGKPRPALVVQSDLFSTLDNVVLCLISSELVDAPLLRQALEASARTGLGAQSQVMIDKMVTVPRTRIGRRIGRVSAETLASVDRALAVFLGVA